MGSAQSSVINKWKKVAADLAPTSSSDVGSSSSNSSNNSNDANNSVNWIDISDSDEDEDNDDDKDERLAILKESRQLKMLAHFFLHPEEPVLDTTVGNCARCYFDRPSAPQQESLDHAEEVARIVKDAYSLKKLAQDYQHPEYAVRTSACATARCYFDRASAPQVETFGAAEERAIIVEEMKLLKKAAFNYLHPEAPVSITDPTVFGRNYFNRPSAPEQEAAETLEILKDVQALRKLAKDYRHPELPVVALDATLFGRNYFMRPSAPGMLEPEEEQEARRILADAKTMKKLAVDYRHPELSIVHDSTMFGRNYFMRASAPEQETLEQQEERAMILKEVNKMKMLAVDYRHPELLLAVRDPTVFGRNYFMRPSAPAVQDWQYEEERQLILNDAHQLHMLAMDFLHPERPIVTSDPTACGRNYFHRASAPNNAIEAERQLILQDAQELHRLAVDYLHPERPVVMSAINCARNYFDRPSAVAQTSWDEEEERDHVLEECHLLEQLAVDYHHPELPVASDPHYDSFDEEDYYYHHAHFDMEDDVHRHHVAFDTNETRHEDMTLLTHSDAASSATAAVYKDTHVDFKFSQSPGCVMTFTDPSDVTSIMAPTLSH